MDCPGRIISIDGDSTIYLGNLFQCLATLIEQYERVLCVSLFFFCVTLCPWPLALLLDATENILSVSSFTSAIMDLSSSGLDIFVEGY